MKKSIISYLNIILRITVLRIQIKHTNYPIIIRWPIKLCWQSKKQSCFKRDSYVFKKTMKCLKCLISNCIFVENVSIHTFGETQSWCWLYDFKTLFYLHLLEIPVYKNGITLLIYQFVQYYTLQSNHNQGVSQEKPLLTNQSTMSSAYLCISFAMH